MNKTVHTAETEPATTELADSRKEATDVLGAVVKTASRYCDALVVSHPVATLVSALWQEADLPARSGTAGVALPPIIATDARAALEEAIALASDGLRIAVMDATDAPRASDEWACSRPLVRYRIVEPFEADTDPLTLVAESPQRALDFSIIAHAAAELSLCGVTVCLTTDLGCATFDDVVAPDAAVLRELLGRPTETITCPTAYQKKIFGDERARVPSEVPEGLDGGRLLADAEKVLDDVMASYEKAVRAPSRKNSRRPPDERPGTPGLRVVIASTRAYSLGRYVAEATAGVGLPTSLRGVPSESIATVELGPAESGVADIVVSPGRARRKLSSVLDGIRDGGSLFLQAETGDPEELWAVLPDTVRARVRASGIRVFASNDAGVEGDQRFEESLLHFVLAATEGKLPDPDIGHRDTSSSNGEAAGTGKAALPFVFEVPWRDYEESPNFYADLKTLRLADTPAATGSDDVLRRLLTFHNTGRHVGRRIDDAGLVPVQLYPYVSSPSTRGPFPVLVPERGQQAHPAPLATIMDGLVQDAETAEEEKRLVARMEAAMLLEYAEDSSADLSEVWKRATERVVAAGDETELRGRIKDLGKGMPEGSLHGFGPATSIRILNWTLDREWLGRFAPVLEDAEALAIMMEEFLRADVAGSAVGRDPQHLREAVGKGYEDELDFEALARIVEETRVVEPLSPGHRDRLESTARDLRQLPQRLVAARNHGVHSGASGLTQAIARAHENLRTVAALIRAIRIALLESSGRYREEIHDPVFSRFGVEHLTDDERAICPPFVVDLGSSATLSRATRGAMLEVLSSDLPVKVHVSVDDIPSHLRTVTEADPSVSAAASLALQAIGLGTAAIMQGSASDVRTFVDASMRAARHSGPALFSLFYGSPSTLQDPDGYLASAAAAESRAFPAFTFDPTGAGWADRISIDSNPASSESWSRGGVTYSTPDTAAEDLTTSFTFADYLALDPRVADHFRVVPVSDWQPQMVEIDEYIELDETAMVDHVPFLWMVDERGQLERVVVTYPITDAVRSALRSWRTIQELGGVKSSFANRILEVERARLEDERERIASEAEEKIRTELDRATGVVAREIVSNIAAGLLGLRPIGGDVATPLLAPARAPATEVEEREDVSESTEPVAPEPQEEEEEAIALDEPYIETPRCTSCNECTNLNSRMFAYDQNKQAYIKDASAGTFREIVLAAEKCPVRIIHPGKPLHPDEPGLEELLKRAQPFQ